MKVRVELEVEAETITAAVSTVLYALDCEGGDVEVLEVRGEASYSSETSLESTTTVHNHVTNCSHTPDAVSLEGQALARRARALPATLT